MKTKDIRITLQSRGYEQGTAVVLESINEELKQTQRDLQELSLLFGKMINTLDGVMVVADNMKAEVERFRGKNEDPAHTELGPSTNSLDKQ